VYITAFAQVIKAETTIELFNYIGLTDTNNDFMTTKLLPN